MSNLSRLSDLVPAAGTLGMVIGAAVWAWGSAPIDFKGPAMGTKDTETLILEEHIAAGGRPVESVSGLTHEEAEVACLRANQRMEGIKAADMGTANLHMRAQIGGCLLLLCGAIALLSRQASKTRQSGAARPERHGQPLASPAGAEQDTRTGLLALG